MSNQRRRRPYERPAAQLKPNAPRKPDEPSKPKEPRKPNEQTKPVERGQAKPVESTKADPSEQPAPKEQPKPKQRSQSGKKRKRRSRFKKLNDKVFKQTGMPLSRLLSIAFGCLLIGGLVFYVRYQGDESSPSSIETPSSQFDTGDSEEQDYLAAVTIPADFAESSLPVRIEKVDWMIDRCTYLLNQDSSYSAKIEEKMLALLALKSVMISESGLDPAEQLELLKKRIAQSTGTSTQLDKHQYLLVVTYLTALAAVPEADIYDGAIEAIAGIQGTTPVPPPTAISCYNSCLKYYVNSVDKTASAKLLRLMGEKLAMSDAQRLSDLGLSLIDYPNFSYYYQDSFSQPKSGTRFESETLELLNQVQKTPPQSVKTYDLLLTAPEQYLQAGNGPVALKIMDQFTAVASQSNAKIRDNVLEKINRQKKRINLLGKKFPLSGVDAAGTEIQPPKKERTLILFWDPDADESEEVLLRIADSRLYDPWSTSVLLASVSELDVKEILTLKKLYPNFRVVDGPTTVDWMEKSGVNSVPYMLTLDQESIVRRLGAP